MEKKIIKFAGEGNVAAIEKLLQEIADEEIYRSLKKFALQGRPECASYLKGVFQGLCESASRKGDLFVNVFRLLGDLVAQDKVASELTGILLLETDGTPVPSLLQIVQCFIESVKSKENDVVGPKTFEIFPKILSCLASKDGVTEGNNHMTGSEFKDHVLNNLCSGRWDPPSVIHLTTMFRDIPLSEEQLLFVIEKVLRILPKLDLQELPALVYQLLLLSAKGPKKQALSGICHFLSGQDSKCRQQDEQGIDGDIQMSESPETLQIAEATIIIHITYAMKQDQELAQEFIHFFKASQESDPGLVLSPFVVALALSVAQIRRFEEAIFEVLKMTIFKNFKDQEQQKACKWMSDFAGSGSDITDGLLEVTKTRIAGWEQVIHGMVQLAFLLMESYGPKFGPFGKGRGKSPAGPPGQRACDLGVKILQSLFKGQEDVQVSILEQTLNRLLTNSSGCSTHYVGLFRNLIKTAPHTVLSSFSKLREILDYLTLLSVPTAQGILNALQPLMKLNVSLKDSLMLLLRKATFARQLESRKVAVLGYLQILKHFQVFGSLPASQLSQDLSSSSNQILVEVHGTRKQPANYEALVCCEILGNLRRCLTQQAEVRKTLYQGLFEVVCCNSKLQVPILSLLYTQLTFYYEKEEDLQPPIKLEPTIITQGEKVILLEPLGDLLQSLVQCTLRVKRIQQKRAADMLDNVEEDDEDEETLDEMMPKVTTLLDSLRRRLLKSEMEDFQLDKSADYSSSSTIGIKNTSMAEQLMNIYEVLIEYTLMSENLSYESAEAASNLYKQYCQVQSAMTDKGEKKGAGRKMKAPKRQATSQLSLSCLATTLERIFENVGEADDNPSLKLKEDLSFCHHLVSVALDKLRIIKDQGECLDPVKGNKEKIVQATCNLAKVFMDRINFSLYTVEIPKEKPVTLLSVEGLEVATQVMCLWYKDHLNDFLQELDSGNGNGEDIAGDTHAKIHVLIKKFQRMITDILATEPDSRFISLKDMLPLCSAVKVLSQLLDPESDQYKQVQAFVVKVCTDHAVDDPSLAKSLLTLHWELTSRTKSGASLIRDVAQDLHSHMGDIDQEMEVENRTHFAIINKKTSSPCLFVVLSWSDQLVDEAEWFISKQTSQLGLKKSDPASDKTSQSATQNENFEKSVCTQLGLLVNAFHELVQSAFPPGLAMLAMTKSIIKLYSALTLLCKHFLSIYTQQLGHFSSRYEKLVKLSGTHLTQYVYALITYVQNTQTEKMNQIPKKQAGKKKKGKGGGGDAAMSGKAKAVMRESRSIPSLIYAIEQYERFLIRLTKKSKVNLLADFKVSTSRDFRINTSVIQAALDEKSDSEEEPNSEEETENEENQEPLEKRKK